MNDGSVQNAGVVQKVAIGALVGSLVTILVWGLDTFAPLFVAHPVPAEIAAALTTILTFVASYLTAPGARESVETHPTDSSKMVSALVSPRP